MSKFWWQVAGFFLAVLLTVTQLRPVLGVEWYGKSEWYVAQANPQSVANYPCDSFSVNAAGKIPPDVPKTEEEKKQFELANPPNPGLVTPNYLYRWGDVPDAPRLARVYGGKPEEWNEHRTPGFMVNGHKVYLRWFRNRYSVVDYEYKFVAECGRKKRRGNPSRYSCDAFKEGFAPYWKGIQDAAAKYANAKHPIPESLLAAIAAQETGGAGASFPKNIQEQNLNGFGTGPYQIDFSNAKRDYYPDITPADVFAPDALTQFPDLKDAFDDKGITPVDASDPGKASEYAAQILEQAWNHFGIIDAALAAYNGGYKRARHPEKTTLQNWGSNQKLSYPDSVKRHQQLIDDAVKRCGAPVTTQP
ncbi:hypothetical protein [Nostoc sp. 'Peltigera membranacea cyanobiont' 232]|uniref:hypothetical protein n=1 Tax=Nostoc sp. 'Peltigera membranacea cyanobiont' 232 TaxID=2014531 RepID=UPI000B9585C0|nr:hypothetical protein [Nostoc sp. 'Peltigera membranacea cyanobiont' 232]OYE01147.1 hypothetical protein CDG79_31135 [Nostoc sp. 'Peltigera membranacea cyanobiont' 232]